jgi:putative transposase
VGARAHCQRVETEAGNPPVASHGRQVFERVPSPPTRSGPALVDLCSQPRPGHVACDFFVVVTARFRILYVFVVLELGRRRILHCNVTDHPRADWTLQQLREALPDDHPYAFLIHDRDSIFSLDLDKAAADLGVRVLRTPPRAPQANAVCERVIGTIRRECLDFLIPLGERHLKHTLNRWIQHYNHGRAHMSLGPGIPAPLHPSPPNSGHRYRLPRSHRVRSKAVLGGLHHEYWLEKVAA